MPITDGGGSVYAQECRREAPMVKRVSNKERIQSDLSQLRSVTASNIKALLKEAFKELDEEKDSGTDQGDLEWAIWVRQSAIEATMKAKCLDEGDESVGMWLIDSGLLENNPLRDERKRCYELAHGFQDQVDAALDHFADVDRGKVFGKILADANKLIAAKLDFYEKALGLASSGS